MLDIGLGQYVPISAAVWTYTAFDVYLLKMLLEVYVCYNMELYVHWEHQTVEGNCLVHNGVFSKQGLATIR